MKKQKTEKSNTNNGITLIALVITIVVMLILVGVTITMAVNGGLFEYAGKAVGDTNNAMQAEQELASGKVTIDNKVYNSIDEYLNSKEETNGVDLNLLGIGDYVNYPVEYTNVATWYTSTGEEKGNYPRDEFAGWRVLSKETDDQGNISYIKLISAGVPLSYCHYNDSDTSVQALTTNFLTTEITSTLTKYKFYKCGFTNVTGTTLAGTFANKFTDKVQALTKDELDKVAVELGGSKTESGTYVNNSKYKDLLAVPCKGNESSQYARVRLPAPADPDRMWLVTGTGDVYASRLHPRQPARHQYCWGARRSFSKVSSPIHTCN